MTHFIAYYPVVLFGTAFLAVLLGWALSLFVEPREEPSRHLKCAGCLAVALCGLVGIAQVPIGVEVLTGFVAGLLAGWFSTEGNHKLTKGKVDRRVYWAILAGIMLLALVVRVPNLGGFGVRIDEPKHIKTAVGYLRTGEFVKWDFFRWGVGEAYGRAYLYTWMVAGSFRLLGTSLASGRLVSLIWGLLLFVPLRGLGRVLELSKKDFLLLFLWIALMPYLVASSRWIRFYAAFTTLHLAAVVCFYWFLHRSDRWRAYGFGLLGFCCLVFALHFQLVGLLSVLGVAVYLLVVHFDSTKQSRIASDRYLIGAGLAACLIGFLLSSYGRVFFFLSDSGSTWGELAGQLTFRPLYGTFLLGEPFGYLLGGVLVAVLLFQSGSGRGERYVFWVVAVPVLCFLFGARRIPQVRFVGHLYPLAFALFLLAARRFSAVVTQNRRVIFGLFFGFITLVVPLHSLPVDFPEIWSGEMGYVGFPKTPSPKYNKWVREFPRFVDDRDYVLAYNIPDYYAPEFRGTGATIRWIARSQQPQPQLSIESIRSAEKHYDRVWIVMLRRFHGLDESVIKYLTSEYRKISRSDDYGNIVIYLRKE